MSRGVVAAAAHRAAGVTRRASVHDMTEVGANRARGLGRAGSPNQTPKITRVPVEGVTSFAGSSR